MIREAIILAGGKGTRLKQILRNIPKPMALINGRPFLEILLNQLVKTKIDHVIISVGHLSHIITDYFGDRYQGLPITYVHETTPLGTGGAIKKSLKKIQTDYSLVLNGDTYTDFNYTEMVSIRKKNNNLVMGLVNVSDLSRYGSVNERNGILTDFIEKGIEGPGYINAGCYLIGKNDLNTFKDNFKFSFEIDFLQKVYKTQPISVIKIRGKFIDIGIPEDFKYAQSYLKYLSIKNI